MHNCSHFSSFDSDAEDDSYFIYETMRDWDTRWQIIMVRRWWLTMMTERNDNVEHRQRSHLTHTHTHVSRCSFHLPVRPFASSPHIHETVINLYAYIITLRYTRSNDDDAELPLMIQKLKRTSQHTLTLRLFAWLWFVSFFLRTFFFTHSYRHTRVCAYTQTHMTLFYTKKTIYRATLPSPKTKREYRSFTILIFTYRRRRRHHSCMLCYVMLHETKRRSTLWRTEEKWKNIENDAEKEGTSERERDRCKGNKNSIELILERMKRFRVCVCVWVYRSVFYTQQNTAQCIRSMVRCVSATHTQEVIFIFTFRCSLIRFGSGGKQLEIKDKSLLNHMK